MPLTLAEVIQQLEDLRYELAVWSLVENKLSPYTDKDNHRRAECGLNVTQCSEPTVPVEMFDRIMETIREEKIDPITQKIEEIESFNVEAEDDEKEIPAKKKTRRKKTTSKKGSKRLRSVSSRARQKGAGSS